MMVCSPSTALDGRTEAVLSLAGTIEGGMPWTSYGGKVTGQANVHVAEGQQPPGRRDR
jgi:hypothetical protein